MPPKALYKLPVIIIIKSEIISFTGLQHMQLASPSNAYRPNEHYISARHLESPTLKWSINSGVTSYGAPITTSDTYCREKWKTQLINNHTNLLSTTSYFSYSFTPPPPLPPPPPPEDRSNQPSYHLTECYHLLPLTSHGNLAYQGDFYLFVYVVFNVTWMIVS